MIFLFSLKLHAFSSIVQTSKHVLVAIKGARSFLFEYLEDENWKDAEVTVKLRYCHIFPFLSPCVLMLLNRHPVMAVYIRPCQFLKKCLRLWKSGRASDARLSAPAFESCWSQFFPFFLDWSSDPILHVLKLEFEDLFCPICLNCTKTPKYKTVYNKH